MGLKETKLKGSYLIEPERFDDERGFFARVFSAREFAAHGITDRFVEGNLSFNRKRSTLRGMHYQADPDSQGKVVRCTAGAIFDVGIDLRSESPTFKQWIGYELSAENRLSFFVPPGFAHGYLTLEDNTEVYYEVSNFYAPENSRGIRWDDPAFSIEWPNVGEMIINERDRTYPDFLL
jgi:dTDP-4-dehydrorhamnose 3,5-epimerase